MEVVLQTGGVVDEFAGKAEHRIFHRVGLGGDVPEGVVTLVVLHDARVIDQVADGAQVVEQRPPCVTVGLVVFAVDRSTTGPHR